MKGLIATILLVFTWSSASAQPLKMGYFHAPPHSFASEQGPIGAAIDFTEAHAELAGMEIQWVGPLPFPRLMKDLRAGKLDGAMLLSKKPEREQFLYYTTTPNASMHPSMAFLADHPIESIDSIQDIDNMRIGFLGNAVAPDFILQHQSRLHLQHINTENWLELNFKKLMSGRLDAVLSLNQYSLLNEASRLGLQDKIKMLAIPEKAHDMYIAFSKNTPNDLQPITEAFNQALSSSQADYIDYVMAFLQP